MAVSWALRQLGLLPLQIVIPLHKFSRVPLCRLFASVDKAFIADSVVTMSQAVGLESLNSSLPAEGMLQPDPHFILQEHELENSRIRSLWSANMTNKPEPTKYLKTAVLMLSWNDSDLDTEPEVCRMSSNWSTGVDFRRLCAWSRFSKVPITSLLRKSASTNPSQPLG